MKYHTLLLLLGLWGACAAPLLARDVLDCPFAPRDRTEKELAHDELTRSRFPRTDISLKEIRARVVKAVNWKSLHPTFKSWINQNQDKYYQWGSNNYVLYNEAHNGIRLLLDPDKAPDVRKIFLNRTRWFDDDAAWEYKKEPAINPATKKPWIELTRAEWKKTASKLSAEDKQFVQDVLDIVNENIHYYYGMPFVDLGRDPKVDKEKLVGKFIPEKGFLFRQHADMLDLSAYTEQQKTLYKALGHPIYSYKGLVDSDQVALSSSNCGGKGFTWVYLKSGLKFSVGYFNQANLDELNPSFGAVCQFGRLPEMYKGMMKGMKHICQEKGCKVKQDTAQDTPLAQALALIYHKTKAMTDAISEHEYVTSSFNKVYFEAGVTRLSDAVKIPGVKTLPSKYKGASDKKKASRTQKERRKR